MLVVIIVSSCSIMIVLSCVCHGFVIRVAFESHFAALGHPVWCLHLARLWRVCVPSDQALIVAKSEEGNAQRDVKRCERTVGCFWQKGFYLDSSPSLKQDHFFRRKLYFLHICINVKVDDLGFNCIQSLSIMFIPTSPNFEWHSVASRSAGIWCPAARA